MPTSRAPLGSPSFSTAHLARRLGVSVPTVQRWVDLGHLKAWKTVGGHRRIDAESAENFIRIQTQQRGGEAMDAASPAEAVVPFSVLVVEDNPNDRDVLCALVEIAVPGARVIVAANGFEALIEVGKAMPDLIVTDITMPHMDGVEMIRHLSTQGDARPPAIVAVSAHTPAHIEKLGGLPASVTLLAKPVEPARFVETVNAALDSI
ncbi:MAG: response regulator [Burkholderiaceae bacterium]|jgi:excisionase family DNA binding protein